MGQKAKLDRSDSADSAVLADLELLLAEGPYLAGDREGAGQRQIRSIQLLSSRLDKLCEMFHWLIVEKRSADLKRCVTFLWLCLDLLAEYRQMLELAAALQGYSAATDDVELQLSAKLGLAAAQRRLGGTAEAEHQAAEALRLAQQLGHAHAISKAWRSLSHCLASRGATGESRQALLLAIGQSEKHQDVHGLAIALNQLGALEFEQGRYQDARERFSRSIVLQQEIGNIEGESRSLSNLAMLEIRAGNHLAARELFEQAMHLKQRLNDRRGEAVCLSNLGSIANDAHDIDLATELYSRSLRQAREIGDKPLQASLLANLGMMAHGRGDFVLAATHLSLALGLYRETANLLGQGITLRFMAMVSLLANEPRQAAVYLCESIETNRMYGANREVAISSGLAGVLLVRQGDLKRGGTLLRAAQLLEETHGYGYEEEIHSILRHGLDEIRLSSFTVSNDDLRSLADPPHSVVDSGRLSELALHTLRERFLRNS